MTKSQTIAKYQIAEIKYQISNIQYVPTTDS